MPLSSVCQLVEHGSCEGSRVISHIHVYEEVGDAGFLDLSDDTSCIRRGILLRFDRDEVRDCGRAASKRCGGSAGVVVCVRIRLGWVRQLREEISVSIDAAGYEKHPACIDLSLGLWGFL